MDDQQSQYGQVSYDPSAQATAAAGQGGQQGHDQHAEEDVEIDWDYTHEEQLQVSMDDLRSVGYEPPADDDSSNSPTYVA